MRPFLRSLTGIPPPNSTIRVWKAREGHDDPLAPPLRNDTAVPTRGTDSLPATSQALDGFQRGEVKRGISNVPTRLLQLAGMRGNPPPRDTDLQRLIPEILPRDRVGSRMKMLGEGRWGIS